jgi:hypothetical protein
MPADVLSPADCWAAALKLDEELRRPKVERLVQLAMAYGWDLGASGHPRPVVLLEWDEVGNAHLRLG